MTPAPQAIGEAATPEGSRPRGRALVIEGVGRKALAVVRSLGRDGWAVTVTSHTRLAPARASRYCSRFVRHSEPGRDAAGFWRAIRGELERTRYDLVLPMEGDGLAALSPRRHELPAGSVFPFASDDVLRRAANKYEVAMLAERLGVPVPVTRQPGSAADLARLAMEVGFPAILKPCEGFGSHGVKRVENLAELEAWYPPIVARFGPVVLQSFVPAGGGEFGVSMLMDREGAVRARFSHRRVRSFPVQGGPSTLRESVHEPEMEADAERLLRALGWYGVAMIEFRRDPRDGRHRLIEINHRFWGSLQLAIASGVDFPALLARTATGEAYPPALDYPDGVLCRWLFPGDVMHFLSNPERFRLQPSFFQFWAPQLHYDVESWSDPLPATLVVAETLARALSPHGWARATRREGAKPG